MKPLFVVSKRKHSWQHIFGGANGALATRHRQSSTVALRLLIGVLFCLVGCGYTGRPTGAGGPQKTSSTPVIQATPSSISFGQVVSGVSYSQSVRLTNTGLA